LQLCLLFWRQFVLDANCQFHVCALNLTLAVQNLVELRQRQLLVYRTGLHRFMQSFHCVLQLPLQLVEARRRAIDLAAHERLLLIGQPQFALMLHDQLRGKDDISDRIPRRRRRRLLLWRWRLWLRRRRLWRLLSRHQHYAKKQRGGEDCDQWSDSLFHKTSPY
jgi:hypothetical protein